MNFDGERSIVCVTESLTALPLSSISTVHSGVALSLELGLELVLPPDHQAVRPALDDRAGVAPLARQSDELPTMIPFSGRCALV
jgi:hypothetical protein